MRKSTIFFTIVMCILLLISGSGKAIAQKVLVNIWDGTEWTKIVELFNAGELPNAQSVGQLFQLKANRKRFPDCGFENCRMKTATKPQHATMLTGVLAGKHGVFSNKFYQLIPDGMTVYEQIEDFNSSIRTAHISSKPPHVGEPTFGNIIEDVDYFFAEDKPAPRAAANQARRLIRKWHEQDFFIVAHFNQPDLKGHRHGMDSTHYEEAIIGCDAELGRILETLDSYNILEETTIYILSDHGFGSPKPTNHINTPNTFIISNDMSITDIYMKDVAGFLLANFGLYP